MFERTRERYPDLQFAQLSLIWQHMPVQYALPEYMELIKNASKRRGLLSIAHQALIDIAVPDIPTPELVSSVSMKLDGLSRELNPPTAMDTKKMLLSAIDRYQTGDDTSQRIRTGFDKIDNLTPVRYGDFLVIGGQEKSGKSMLATNIIANIILNETNTAN
jgi:replicative DNA helicase